MTNAFSWNRVSEQGGCRDGSAEEWTELQDNLVGKEHLQQALQEKTNFSVQEFQKLVFESLICCLSAASLQTATNQFVTQEARSNVRRNAHFKHILVSETKQSRQEIFIAAKEKVYRTIKKQILSERFFKFFMACKLEKETKSIFMLAKLILL